MKLKNASTPSLRATPQEGNLVQPRASVSKNTEWGKNSLYPYWEVPKNKKLNVRAKELRKAGNLSEVLFWEALKNKEKIGFDIDRQVIIGNYIVDFFIPELGLVFEIDGSSHDDKQDYDKERDTYMQSFNLQIIRVSDLEVKKNMNAVYAYILKSIKEREIGLKFPS